MSNDPVIPKKINKYIQRLIIEHRKKVNPFDFLKRDKESTANDFFESSSLLNILEKGKVHFIYYYDGFNCKWKHKIIFSVPEECFEKDISISNQKTLSKKLKIDLNQVITESDESIEDVKFELKDEIDVQTYLKRKIVNPESLNLWDKECLRVFISHSVKDYEVANQLKNQLKDSSISCFVAHKDIKPTTVWEREIRKALKSMEIMILFVTEDSCKSWWVNQEIGSAWNQNIPIIPIKLDQHDPKGFISGIQAMKLNKEHIISGRYDLREKLVGCIKNNLPQHPVWKKNLLSKFLQAKDSTFAYAKESFMNIIDFQFDNQEIEKIVETINGPARYNNNQLRIILLDGIESDHLNKLSSKKYNFYAELLRDKILSQHTKNRYSIIKRSEKNFVSFSIIDNHQAINNQKLDASNTEDLPF